jgi:tetratricopeptide (TPR) repeat protein
VIYDNLHEDDLAAAMITRAYRLRDTLGERERFYVLARYNGFVTGDIPEGLRIYGSWTQVYPSDAVAWANLSNKENWIGRNPEAVAAGRRALALDPNSETSYVVLARALLHAGRLAEAQAVCAQAAARGVDGDDLHSLLFQIAAARDDTAGEARQLAWAQGKPGERTLLTDAGQAAYNRGEIERGEALFAHALDLGKPYGLRDIFAAPNARLLQDLGRRDLALQSLARVPAGFDSPDYRFTLAEIGDAARADALLRADIARAPTNTLLTQVFACEQRAAEALRRGQPQAAVAALEPARPYEMRTFDIPYLRGEAYLAAHDGARAAVEFRKVLSHRGVEAVSSHYTLSQLGLARALRLQRDLAGSRAAYEQFFRDWLGADPGMPLLSAARSEYAGLGN